MGDNSRFICSPYKGHDNANRYRSSGFSLDQTIEADFSKKKKLEKSWMKWALPPPSTLFKCTTWENKHLMLGKKELNDVKNLLSDFEMKDWHKHTRETNHAGLVVSTVRRKIHPELLTQAWCKFYEIVSCYNLVPEEAIVSNSLNSVHLCEAPGAFITSLNHFLKLHLPDMKWQWRASTLNPYCEGNKLSFMINDDRFILHTIDSWEFGRDQSGNLMELENISSIISVAKRLAPVLLVTADGSIDCQGDPGEQEAILTPLHYSETFVALNVLAQGGSFLIKMFTVFESPTICLLYLLSCLFETVQFFKPATSKGGNSEVYVICLNFSGPSAVQPYLDVFKSKLFNSSSHVMFSEDQIPLDFLCQISECSDFFKALQVNALKRNLETYKVNNNEESAKLYKLKQRLSYSYLERYRLEPLSLPDHYIVGNELIKQTPTLNLDFKIEESIFSYSSLQDLSNVELFQGYQSLIDRTEPLSLEEGKGSKSVLCFETDQLHKGLILNVDPIFGSPVLTVYSSKFCLGSLLKIWNHLNEVKKMDLHNCFKFDDALTKLSVLVDGLNVKALRVCDMSGVPYVGNVCFFEKECMIRLVQLLHQMKTDEDLVLLGVPLLTRVSVGLVFFIAQAFCNVRFFDPLHTGYAVLFSQRRSTDDVCSALENLLKNISNENSLALHSFVSVKTLLRDVNWYKCILYLNHTYLKNVSTNLIQEFLSGSTSQDT